MTTIKKVKSNRQNARKSTGPRGADAKSRSSQNALKHGLFACNPVLPDEDADAYADHCTRLLQELHPVGYFEELLVDQIADLLWRLRRVVRIEAAVFEAEHTALQIAEDAAKFDQKMQRAGIPSIGISEAKKWRIVDRAYEDTPLADPAWIGTAFINSQRHGALEKLALYETRKLRELEKLLGMLCQRQNERYVDCIQVDDQRRSGKVVIDEDGEEGILVI